MESGGFLRWLASPTMVVALAVASLIEGVYLVDAASACRMCYHRPILPVVRTASGLTVDLEGCESSPVVGHILAANLTPHRTGALAATTRWLVPDVLYVPDDGRTPAIEEVEQLREPYARVVEREYANPELASVIRANAGRVGVPILSGYLTNLIVLGVPGLFLCASCACVIHRTREQRREYAVKAGLCPHCGYDLLGNTTGLCPECGLARTH